MPLSQAAFREETLKHKPAFMFYESRGLTAIDSLPSEARGPVFGRLHRA